MPREKVLPPNFPWLPKALVSGGFLGKVSCELGTAQGWIAVRIISKQKQDRRNTLMHTCACTYTHTQWNAVLCNAHLIKTVEEKAEKSEAGCHR